MEIWSETPPHAVAVVEGDVEAMEWLIQRYDAEEIVDTIDWRHHLGWLAAKHGKIESLKCLQANSCTWEFLTCEGAAEGGHLEVLQWARQNGCPWDAYTCVAAVLARDRGCVPDLEVLKWARRNELPVGRGHVRVGGEGRAPGGVAVGASERVPVGREDVHCRGGGRPPGGVAVGASERVPVERGHVRVRGGERAPGGVAVVASERVPVGRGHVRVRGGGRPPGGAAVGASERVPVGLGHVRVRGGEGTWRCCSGRVRTGARGTRGRATAAAKGGHLEVLQWARQNGCPWDSDTCAGDAAAKRGDLEVLQWLRQNGCPWNQDVRLPRRREGTWRCCSGRIRTGAHGTKGRALPRRGKGTWRCCSGRVRTGARGTRTRARGSAVGARERVPVERGDVDQRQIPLPPVLDRARVPGSSVTRGASPTTRTRTLDVDSSEHARALPATTRRRQRDWNETLRDSPNSPIEVHRAGFADRRRTSKREGVWWCSGTGEIFADRVKSPADRGFADRGSA